MEFFKRNSWLNLQAESSNKQLVWRLHKAINGLKQAPRAWFDKLKATLHLKFSSSKCDPSLFVYSEAAYILVYVDDIINSGNNFSLIMSLVSKLNPAFSLKDLGQLE